MLIFIAQTLTLSPINLLIYITLLRKCNFQTKIFIIDIYNIPLKTNNKSNIFYTHEAYPFLIVNIIQFHFIHHCYSPYACSV